MIHAAITLAAAVADMRTRRETFAGVALAAGPHVHT